MADVMAGRVPPQDLNAEQALLGILLMDSDLLEEISTVIRADDFYEKTHQAIYNAMLEFHEKEQGHTLDLQSFVTFLTGSGRVQECGGIDYLARLCEGDRAALIGNAQLYAKAIKDASRRRQTALFAAGLRDQCYDDKETDIQAILNDAQAKLGDLAVSGSTGAQYDNMGQVMDLVYSIVDPEEKPDMGIPTGFSYLDDVTGGMRKQEMTIIAARPSVGKTAFALSIALNMAKAGRKVGFFSLEMSSKSIGCRLVSMLSGVDFSHIMKKTVTKDELSRLIDAIGSLYQMKIFLQDTANMKLMDLRAQAHQMKIKEQIEILFIDYIGLIENDNPTATEERFNWIGKVSRQLKQLARELDIPVVVLCQVSRDAEDQEPKLSNLRDSGSIEQDADVVLLLHRPRPKEGEPRKPILETSLIVAKNRNGETGTCKLAFKGSVVHFTDLEGSYTSTPAMNKNA